MIALFTLDSAANPLYIYPMKTLQDTLLDAALPLVVFDGWSDKTLQQAALNAGLPAIDGARAFPGGGIAALEYFLTRADSRMVAALENDYVLTQMKIRERIATAVMVRLEQNTAHREAVRRGMALLALPWNAGIGLNALYRTVDAMWRCAGDSSTDWNFYSKRLLLANVYSSTLMVWLNDHSDNLDDTRAFLHRRINDVMQIEKAKAKVKSWFSAA